MSVHFDLSKEARANLRAGLRFNIRSSAPHTPALQKLTSPRNAGRRFQQSSAALCCYTRIEPGAALPRLNSRTAPKPPFPWPSLLTVPPEFHVREKTKSALVLNFLFERAFLFVDNEKAAWPAGQQTQRDNSKGRFTLPSRCGESRRKRSCSKRYRGSFRSFRYFS